MKRIILEEKRRTMIAHTLRGSSSKMRLTIGCLTVLLIILFVEIWVANRTSTYGDKIYQLKQSQARLELENQVLANSIAASSAMVLLERKANLLGFNTINQLDYIKLSDKLASAN